MKQLPGIMTALMLLSLIIMPANLFADDGDKAALDSAALDRLLDAAITNANANGVLMDRADSLRFKVPHPTAKDTADFVAIYRQLADGLPWAAFEMGQVYLLGLSVSIDTAEAVAWYVKSAEMGYTQGMRSAGIACLNGIGRTADIPAGLNWLAKSAEGGNTDAAAYIGELYFLGDKYTTQNDSLAIKYLYMASDSGDIESQRHLADIYADDQSRWYNEEMAFKWAAYLADKGEAKYEERVGSYYYGGIGTEEDYAKAGTFYYQAAQQSRALSATAIGELYYDGSGCKQNYVQALAWAYRGKQLGDTAYAPLEIEDWESEMTPAQKDSAKTIVPDWDPFTEADARYEEVKKERDEQIKAGKVRPGSKGQTRGGRAGASAPTTTTDSATATDSTNTKTTTPQTKSRRPR